MTESYQQWVERNPYRAFYLKQEWSQLQAAVEVGVSPNSLRGWFFGGILPSAENFQSIAKVMGMAYDDLVRQWHEWRDSKPAPPVVQHPKARRKA